MSGLHHINGRQLMFIITGGQVGTAMLALPAILSREAGQHAWICVLLGAIVPILNVIIIEKLGSRHLGLNVVQLFQALLGRVLGYAMIIVFIIYLALSAIYFIDAFARLIQLFMLPRTPFWITVLLAMVCIVYAGSKGGQVVGRINETLFFGLVLSLIAIVIPALYHHDPTNLLPLGELDARELLRGIFYSIFAFAGTEILLVLYSQVDKPEQVKSAALKGVGLSTAAYLIVTICCLLVFGAERMVRYSWPGVTILKIAQVPVLERLEFYFLAIWVGIVLRRIINVIFSAALAIAQLFKAEDKIASIMLLIGAAIFSGSFISPTVMQYDVLLEYFSIVYLLIGMLLPLLLLLISWFRKEVFDVGA
jgi:spore germination protein (amino acid permease)